MDGKMEQDKNYESTSGALGYQIHNCNGWNCQNDDRPKVSVVKAAGSILKDVSLDTLLITSPLILASIVDNIMKMQ